MLLWYYNCTPMYVGVSVFLDTLKENMPLFYDIKRFFAISVPQASSLTPMI